MANAAHGTTISKVNRAVGKVIFKLSFGSKCGTTNFIKFLRMVIVKTGKAAIFKNI